MIYRLVTKYQTVDYEDLYELYKMTDLLKSAKTSYRVEFIKPVKPQPTVNQAKPCPGLNG